MGLFEKTYKILVMDGTNYVTVSNIVNLIGCYADRKKDSIRCNDLAWGVPGIEVVEATMSWRNWRKVRKILDSVYPGLCVFNPRIKCF